MESYHQRIIREKFPQKTEGKFILFRHGTSIYNSDTKYKDKKLMKTMQKYIDDQLNEEGEKETILKQEIINKLDISEVYVSPMEKTLQTALLLLKTHPNRDKIKVIVHPYLTEFLGYIHNFMIDNLSKQKIYNFNSEVKFDWSLFNSMLKTDQQKDLFYLDNMDLLYNKQNEKIYKKNFDDIYYYYDNYNIPKLKDSLEAIARAASVNRMPTLESYDNLNWRCTDFQKFLLKKYRNELKDSKKKILIITHNCFIQMFTSNKACFAKYSLYNIPKDAIELNNTEYISMNIYYE